MSARVALLALALELPAAAPPRHPSDKVARRCVGPEWGRQLPERAGALRCRGRTMRFELRRHDVWPRDHARGADVERAEIAARTTLPPDRDVWIAFSMRVLPGAPTSGKWLEAAQLHNTPDAGEPSPSPAFAQGFERGDVFRVTVRASADDPLRVNPRGRTLYREPGWRRGVFRRFVYRVRYSPIAGALDLWIDGRRRVAYRGPLGYRDARGPYLKFGIYRAAAPETIAIDYRDIAVGDMPPRRMLTRRSSFPPTPAATTG